MAEDRTGGTEAGAVAPDGQPFEESVRTRNADVGAVWRSVVHGKLLSLRGSLRRGWQDLRFGAEPETGVHLTWFGEASLTGTHGRHTFVGGVAFTQDRYDARELPQFDYAFDAPAVFGQDEIAFSPRFALAASARVDFHSRYGTLASPRLSLLLRPNAHLSVRTSAGTGSFTPTPFDEVTEGTGLRRLRPFVGVRVESARGVSADATWRTGPVEITATGFGSSVSWPTQLRNVSTDAVEFVNAAEPTHTWGTELLARYRVESLEFIATHAWTRSTELDVEEGVRTEVPLTPRHAASLNALWRDEDRGRVGIELYYVGEQVLRDNPYRTAGRRHVLLGMFGEWRIGKVRAFANAENLLDVRQTKFDPLVRSARLPDGRWTVDAWAPLDGRVINAGVRVAF